MGDQLGGWMREDVTIDERLRALEAIIHGELIVRAAEDAARGTSSAEEVLEWAHKWANVRTRERGEGPPGAVRIVEKFKEALKDYRKAQRRP